MVDDVFSYPLDRRARRTLDGLATLVPLVIGVWVFVPMTR